MNEKKEDLVEIIKHYNVCINNLYESFNMLKQYIDEKDAVADEKEYEMLALIKGNTRAINSLFDDVQEIKDCVLNNQDVDLSGSAEDSESVADIVRETLVEAVKESKRRSKYFYEAYKETEIDPDNKHKSALDKLSYYMNYKNYDDIANSLTSEEVYFILYGDN
jgi:hypothetical protein